MAVHVKEVKTMIKKKKKIKVKEDKVTVRRRGGGTLIGSRPIFSADNKYVYLNCGWGVKIFSVETGECVKVLQWEDSKNRVLSIIRYDRYVGAVTRKGIFTLWNPRTAEVSLTYKIKREFELTLEEAFLVPSVSNKTTQDLCCVYSDITDKIFVRFYDIQKNVKIKGHPLNRKIVSDMWTTHSLSSGGPEDYPLLAAISSKGLNIYCLNGRDIIHNINPGGNRKWTCVRCHPCDDVVAVGDDTGRVVLMRASLNKGGPKPVYHWHTLPCKDIAFSPAGSSMFTGGGEHVLVKWNLENPHIKNFLPRLSSHIVHITVSSDNQLVAIATLDNGVQIVNSSNKLQCVLQQLSWSILPSDWHNPFPAGLVYDPRTRSIVLNGRPGHLQMYSPETESMVQIIDVTTQNYITQERNKVIVNTEVTGCAFSDDGAWMATIETRAEEGVALEIRMKMWQYLLSKKCFSLNTSIELPHDGSVNSIKFQPRRGTFVANDSDISLDYMVITTGGDRKARIWSPSNLDSVYRKGVLWECQNTCHYRDKKCSPCSFSYDGSLFAVGFETALTLWDSEAITLKESLSRGNNPLTYIEFGRRDCCHLILCTTESEVCVWDLLNLSLLWSVQIAVHFVVSDPFSNNMAVFTPDKKLSIFHLNNSEPIYINKKLGREAVAGVFVPRKQVWGMGAPWLRTSQLFYLDLNQELHSFECEIELDSTSQSVHMPIMKSDPLTPFGAVIAGNHFNDVVAEQKAIHAAGGRSVESAKAISQLLKSGAHTLPPVSLLCNGLLRALVTLKLDKNQNQTFEGEESDSSKMEVDDSSSSDEDDDTSKRSLSKSPKSPKTTKREAEPAPALLPKRVEDLRELFSDLDEVDSEEEIPRSSKFVIDDGSSNVDVEMKFPKKDKKKSLEVAKRKPTFIVEDVPVDDVEMNSSDDEQESNSRKKSLGISPHRSLLEKSKRNSVDGNKVKAKSAERTPKKTPTFIIDEGGESAVKFRRKSVEAGSKSDKSLKEKRKSF